MKTLESRKEETSQPSQRKRKIRVDILGRGNEEMSIHKGSTVRELRHNLNVGSQTRAVDNNGNPLADETVLDSIEEVNFIPNVKGGGEE